MLTRATPFVLTCCVCTLLFATGCAKRYVTPGGAADLQEIAAAADQPYDPIQAAFTRKPAAQLPAHLALVRVQDSGYRHYSPHCYGHGPFTVITVRDVETDDHVKRIAQLPQVAGLAPLNRLLLPAQLRSQDDLRQAAARMQADMLLLYTFDTKYDVGDALAPLSVVTLGLSPNQVAKVDTTASALLIDVRTGYIYGSVESTANTEQLANAWTSDAAVDQSRKRTERKAFDDLVAEFEKLWPEVVRQRLATSRADAR